MHVADPRGGKKRAKDKIMFKSATQAIHKTSKGVTYLLSESSQFSSGRIEIDNGLVLDLPSSIRISEGVQSLFKVTVCWTDTGDHHRVAVTSQGI